jgi:predicted SAM-dependent methyltransferase
MGLKAKKSLEKKAFFNSLKKGTLMQQVSLPSFTHSLFALVHTLSPSTHTPTHTHTLYTYWYTHNLFFVLFIDIFTFNWLLLHTDISPSYLCHELTLQSDDIFFSFFLFLYLFFSSFLNPFSFLLWNCLSYIFLSLILIFFISISL